MKHSPIKNIVESKKFKATSLALALSTVLLTSAHAEKNEVVDSLSEQKRIEFDGAVSADIDKIKELPEGMPYLSGGSDYGIFGEGSNNTVLVKNFNKVDEIFNIFGGISLDGNASNNEVVIKGNVRGDVSGMTVPIISGGYGHLDASRNKVTIEGNVRDALVTGGMISGHDDAERSANYNEVNITGSLDNQGSLGTLQVVGGLTMSGSANHNKVTIGKNANAWIIGGAGAGVDEDEESAFGTADFNTVEIGGDYSFNFPEVVEQLPEMPFLIGGLGGLSASNNEVILHGDILSSATGGLIAAPNGVAINNTITITGKNAQDEQIGTEELRLYGGTDARSISPDEEGSKDVFTGNTLNFSAGQLRAHTIKNFEHYNFTLDPKLVNSDEASITVENIELGDHDGNIASKVSVVGIKQGAQLEVDDEFLLIKSGNMTGKGEGVTTKGIAQQGISVLYDVETTVDVENGEAKAVIIGSKDQSAGRVNPQLKALSEGNLANLMLVTRGADIAAYSAFDTIKAQNEGGLNTFVLMEGSHNRYSSGSHIKSNDFHLMTGVSLRQDNITAAAFVEAGWGDYDTRNSFVDAANVDGDGKSRYVGVGVLGKYDFANGLYVDGSFRIGSSHNKFNASDIRNFTTGEEARYSFSRTYVSAHAGLGYLYDIDSTNAIDFSAKYLWTHLGSKNLTVAGDNIKFKSLDSNRLQFRAIWNHQANDAIQLKAGVGYEYEFSAKAKATALDMYSVNAPSVKGGTGIATVGISVNPESNRRLNVDFNINGYTGKRDGVGANIKVGYRF